MRFCWLQTRPCYLLPSLQIFPKYQVFIHFVIFNSDFIAERQFREWMVLALAGWPCGPCSIPSIGIVQYSCNIQKISLRLQTEVVGEKDPSAGNQIVIARNGSTKTHFLLYWLATSRSRYFLYQYFQATVLFPLTSAVD